MIPLRALLRRDLTPVVTIAIIVINLFTFLTEMASPGTFVRHYALIPDRFHVGALLTYMFLHGGWFHLIGNMWFLWVFGSHLENALGSTRYLIFYLACGFTAGSVQYLLNIGSPIPTLGASGAIAGVMGAFLVLYPHVRVVTLIFIVFFITTVEIPAAFMLLYWFAIQLFSGLASTRHLGDSGGVAWFAHVGGFLVGLLLVRLFPTRRFLTY
jgi:membrane associated rhomboid family serine protease